MTILLIKLIMAPLLISGATLAVRRWGPAVGGWIVGLPLTSGPVSVFLLVEQGREFAALSAHSTLNGLLSVVAFCLVYERSSRRFPWPAAAALSLAAYFAVVTLFNTVHPPLWASVALVCGGITLALAAVKPVTETLPVMSAPYWDLPVRMITATLLVVTITGVSRNLGPSLSGLFSTFPIFICLMSVFSQHIYGTVAVRKFEHGVISGSYAFAVFFIIAAFTLRAWSPALVYTAAIAGALGTNLVVYNVLRALHLNDRG
ncbi:MAG: hypothetical protein LBR29_05995 [Methylobacteriaceae bacterium]|jgi:hypothetical protein|nr:hypothetical protein [Methylobacteriaceae bacterium]